MKAFVINLDHRPDRLADISSMLQSIGIKFERVSAVDGRVIDTRERVNWTKAYVYAGFGPPSSGQIGVYESHRQAWQKIIDQNLDQALVFEDDAICFNYDERFLKVKLADFELDQLRLEELHVPVEYPFPTRSGQISILDRNAHFDPTYGAAAYITTQAGARKLLKAGKFWFNIDHHDLWENATSLKTAILRPNLFVQCNSISDIATSKPAPFEHKNGTSSFNTKGILNAKIFCVKLFCFLAVILPWPIKMKLRQIIVNRYLDLER